MSTFEPDKVQLAVNPDHWSGLERLRSACLGMVLVEVEGVSASPEVFFTPREAARAARLGSRRRKGFKAARAALKALARQLELVESDRPDRDIETLGPDEMRPCLAGSGLHCSVSHTGQFVVAVAHVQPVGVDIEAVSGKALRAWHLFVSPPNQDLISPSSGSPEREATRAWTIKEAAAKAFNLGLEQAIREVAVVLLSEEESLMRYQGNLYPVSHGEGDGHMISLITCGGS
jgi:phosphopantetheinyl transferase